MKLNKNEALNQAYIELFNSRQEILTILHSIQVSLKQLSYLNTEEFDMYMILLINNLPDYVIGLSSDFKDDKIDEELVLKLNKQVVVLSNILNDCIDIMESYEEINSRPDFREFIIDLRKVINNKEITNEALK